MNQVFRRAAKIACAVAVACALAGCIFVPVRGPAYGFYRPHPHYYY